MRIRRPMCVISLLFILALYIILTISGGVDEKEYDIDGRNVSIQGIIIDKVVKNGKTSIHIRNKSKFIVYIDSQEINKLHIGQKVEICGTYRNFLKPENDGQFNMKKYYRIRGYEAYITKAKITKYSNGYSKVKDHLYNIKEKTKGIYYSNMSETEAGTLSAMVLGDKTGLDAEIKNNYQNAGISHILSLSGLHIATVGMFIFTLFRKSGLGEKLSSVISIIIIIAYAIMTGLSTSTIRALIMFILALTAKNVERTYDLLSAVYFAGILILFEHPYYVYDSGFLMSYTAVAGIGIIYPVIFELTDSRLDGFFIFERIRQSMCISISAFLATLPVVMNSFYKTSRYGLIINILVVPLMSIILAAGILSALLGNIFLRGPLQNIIVKIPLLLNEKILKLYSSIAEKSSVIPGNVWITGKSSSIQIIVYIMLMLSVCLMQETYKEKNEKVNISKKLGLLITILLAIFIISFRNIPEMSVNCLSVGQGACNVIYGKNVPVVIIDGGSIDVKDVGKYRIIPFLLFNGIDTIDYIFVTHSDEDHVSGIKEILTDSGGIKIRYLFLSDYDKELIDLAKKRNINVKILSVGDKIESKRTVIEILNPEKQKDLDNKNDRSLVIKATYNNSFEMLFTGDISSETENKLLNNPKCSDALKNIEYVTVPHHGSKYSSCEEFIKKLNGKIFVISVGENNSYGHPHKETLERLNKCASGARVFRTDKSGQVTIIVGKDCKVRQFMGRNSDDK